VTLGHIDIIRRATKLFDRVIVVVMTNFAKKSYVFTPEQRLDFLRRSTAGMERVEVDRYDGLLVDFAQKMGASAIVKGLRAVSDFEDEFQQALTNRRLSPGVETVFLTTSSEYMFLSSSIVRQVCVLGRGIEDFVPGCILDDIVSGIRRSYYSEK